MGWHAATDKRTDLVQIAMWDRDRHGNPVRPGDLLHYSDAGSQYTSLRFTEHLALEGIAPSIGSVGDAYDNGLMESIIGLFKTEAIATDVFHTGPYKTLADVEYATASWVDWWNHRRLHSSLGRSHPPSTTRTTTLPSTESGNPYESGREPVTVQSAMAHSLSGMTVLVVTVGCGSVATRKLWWPRGAARTAGPCHRVAAGPLAVVRSRSARSAGR